MTWFQLKKQSFTICDWNYYVKCVIKRILSTLYYNDRHHKSMKCQLPWYRTNITDPTFQPNASYCISQTLLVKNFSQMPATIWAKHYWSNISTKCQLPWQSNQTLLILHFSQSFLGHHFSQTLLAQHFSQAWMTQYFSHIYNWWHIIPDKHWGVTISAKHFGPTISANIRVYHFSQTLLIQLFSQTLGPTISAKQ